MTLTINLALKRKYFAEYKAARSLINTFYRLNTQYGLQLTDFWGQYRYWFGRQKKRVIQINRVSFLCVWLKFYKDIHSPQRLKCNEKFSTISRSQSWSSMKYPYEFGYFFPLTTIRLIYSMWFWVQCLVNYKMDFSTCASHLRNNLSGFKKRHHRFLYFYPIQVRMVLCPMFH